MFTKRSLLQLNIVFTLLTFFCIFPFDWNRKTKSLTKTKNRLKIMLNNLIVYLIPIGITYMGIRFYFDLQAGKFPLHSITMNIFILIGTAVSCTIAIASKVIGQDYLDLTVNAVFQMDQALKDAFPNASFGNQLIPKIGAVVEPIVFLHSGALGLLFLEKHDMFRLYFYNPVEYILDEFMGIRIPLLKLGGLALYMGLIRIIYSHFVVATYTIGMYAQLAQTWLNELLEMENILGLPHSELVHYYKTQYLLNQLVDTNAWVRIISSAAFSGLFLLVVICTYNSIMLIDSVNFFSYMVNPTAAIAIILVIRVWFGEAGKLDSVSKELINTWTLHSGGDKEFKMQLKTFRPLRHSVNGYFNLEKSKFAEFMDQVIDKTITLILDMQ